MAKNYLAGIVDLTGDTRINPPTLNFGDNEGSHARSIAIITSISVHHDAQARLHDYDSVARYVQQAAERSDLGPGLPYHYRIDNTGVIFFCRPLTTWLNCVGSSENPTTIAICLDGNFETQLPTLEQCEAFFQLAKELATNHPEFPATWPDVRPHADFSATACCGLHFREYIYAIKDEATALNFPANSGYDWPEYQLPAPTPAPAPKPQPAPIPQPKPQPQPAPTPAPVKPPVQPVPPVVSPPIQPPKPSSPPVSTVNDTPKASPLERLKQLWQDFLGWLGAK